MDFAKLKDHRVNIKEIKTKDKYLDIGSQVIEEWNMRVAVISVVVIYEGLYFDLAQGQMNGAPNETRTHLCRFASLTC